MEPNITPNTYHALSIEKTIEIQRTSLHGLSDSEASKRLETFGRNELAEGRKKSLFIRFLLQLKDVMVLILIAAAVISIILGESADAGIILVVVLLNAVLGLVQESKAEKALEALKNMSKPYAKVKREGKVRQIASSEIVPGDIVLIEAGDMVPADLRLIETASLKIEEAALTGESVPVEKSEKSIAASEAVLGDRFNMAYSGSSVSYGRGAGIAVQTGMDTEMGKIAGYISAEESEQTPLQKKLAEMGKYLSIGVAVIAVIIFAAGMIRGREIFEMFLTSVSLAVAAIPEGLPAVVTIVLAMGVQKMAGRNAIIRKLPAVETLGRVEIICSDKTGTLTQNKMTVKELYFADNSYTSEASIEGAPGFFEMIQAMTLCNDSKPADTEEDHLYTGDPTETALAVYASQKGFHKFEMENSYVRKSEIPFDSDRKLMTTLNEAGANIRTLTKGALDMLLDRCTDILTPEGIKPLSQEFRSKIENANRHMASKALRVLAFAYRDISSLPDVVDSDTIENNLIFIGLVGMIDPPRPEAKDAVRVCRKAGIRPIMITGDHRDTAAAIAKELEIIKDESEVITGNELDRISKEDFLYKVVEYSVYARVSPEHKVRIVNAWKGNGKIVSMTGDGVNDAPALKAADIGVGMGITGTDVSKGVSDMVLSDDNFATIVAAVGEGRKIYENIKKNVQFLLSANMGEVATLFVATMLNWKILFPIHILWINLVTDTLPALALGVEKADRNIMEEKPNKSGFFAEGLGFDIIYQGVAEALLILMVFFIGMTSYTENVAITMAFVTLGLIQLAHSYNVRSASKSLFSIGPFSNRYLNGAALISGFLQVAVVIIPPLNPLFRVTALDPLQWLISLGAAIAIIPLVEAVKILKRRKIV